MDPHMDPLSHLRPAPKPSETPALRESRESRAERRRLKTSGAPAELAPDKRLKRNAKQRGKRAEQRIADLLGGRQTISSGRTALEKGDVRVEDLNLFIEVKYCGVRQGRGETSVTFDREWLEKTILDAEAVGMLPLIALRFRDGSGAYATTDTVFETLIAALRAYKNEANDYKERYFSLTGKGTEQHVADELP